MPVLLGVPGALTLGAAQARRRVDATAFGALAFLLSALWLAFATLILTVFKMRISGVSVYACLLLVCCVLTAAAQWQLRRRAGDEDAVLPSREPADMLSVPDEIGASPKRGAWYAVGGVLAGAALLGGGALAYAGAPHQAPAGYTWLAWSGAKANGVIAVGAHGIRLPFEIAHQAPGTTEYRLTASWTGGGKAHALAAPQTLRVGGDKIVRATLSIPQPPGACAYRVVVTLTELGTARPQSWSINAGVRADRAPAAGRVRPMTTPAASLRRARMYVRVARGDSLVRNSLYMMSATVATAVLGYIFWIVAARVFSTAQVGIASAVISLCSTVALLTYLGPAAMLVERLHTYEQSPAWNSFIVRMCAATAAVTAVFAAVTIPLIAHTKGYGSYFSAAGAAVLAVIGAAVWTVVQMYCSAFIAARRADGMFAVQGLVSLFKVLLLMPLCAAGLGARGIVVAWAASAVIGVALGAFWLLPRIGPDAAPPEQTGQTEADRGSRPERRARHARPSRRRSDYVFRTSSVSTSRASAGR